MIEILRYKDISEPELDAYSRVEKHIPKVREKPFLLSYPLLLGLVPFSLLLLLIPCHSTAVG